MYLKSLHIINYRNINQADIELSYGVNCFVGKNGAGKTNLLDSIYYMSFCKSSFGVVDSQNIYHNEPFFVIQGEYVRDNQTELIYCGVKKGQKKQFKRNKKDYQKLADHIGLLPLVIISPTDENLISESAEYRRKYADSVISQCDKHYLDILMRYNKLILQRNFLLKQMQDAETYDLSLLDTYDVQLGMLGTEISRQREMFVERLRPILEQYYQQISSGTEQVTMNYVSGLQRYNLYEGLVESRNRDLALGYTSRGIHKDDIEFMFDGFLIKRVGSQGQQKSFVIALKLAQFHYLSQYNGVKPILLLDDVFDKLDNIRGDNLINMVSKGTFDQIFITDTDRGRLMSVLSNTHKDYKIFEVEGGTIQ